VIAVLLALLACGSEPASPPEPEAPAAPARDPEAEALAEADRLASAAAQALQTRMVQEMKAHGPEGALEACSMEAEALTRSVVEADTEARVGRASLRLRSAANAPPDWVEAWLDAQGERGFAGVEGFARIEPTAEGPVARVLRPIPVEERCLACHGPSETLAADVRNTLDERYPDDAARGYAAGDLRGALWAEVAVTR
jgi:hypothetical protein